MEILQTIPEFIPRYSSSHEEKGEDIVPTDSLIDLFSKALGKIGWALEELIDECKWKYYVDGNTEVYVCPNENGEIEFHFKNGRLKMMRFESQVGPIYVAYYTNYANLEVELIFDSVTKKIYQIGAYNAARTIWIKKNFFDGELRETTLQDVDEKGNIIEDHITSYLPDGTSSKTIFLEGANMITKQYDEKDDLKWIKEYNGIDESSKIRYITNGVVYRPNNFSIEWTDKDGNTTIREWTDKKENTVKLVEYLINGDIRETIRDNDFFADVYPSRPLQVIKKLNGYTIFVYEGYKTVADEKGNEIKCDIDNPCDKSLACNLNLGLCSPSRAGSLWYGDGLYFPVNELKAYIYKDFIKKYKSFKEMKCSSGMDYITGEEFSGKTISVLNDIINEDAEENEEDRILVFIMIIDGKWTVICETYNNIRGTVKGAIESRIYSVGFSINAEQADYMHKIIKMDNGQMGDYKVLEYVVDKFNPLITGFFKLPLLGIYISSPDINMILTSGITFFAIIPSNNIWIDTNPNGVSVHHNFSLTEKLYGQQAYNVIPLKKENLTDEKVEDEKLQPSDPGFNIMKRYYMDADYFMLEQPRLNTQRYLYKQLYGDDKLEPEGKTAISLNLAFSLQTLINQEAQNAQNAQNNQNAHLAHLAYLAQHAQNVEHAQYAQNALNALNAQNNVNLPMVPPPQNAPDEEPEPNPEFVYLSLEGFEVEDDDEEAIAVPYDEYQASDNPQALAEYYHQHPYQNEEGA